MPSDTAAVNLRIMAWVLAGYSRRWISARLGLDDAAVDGHLGATLSRLIPASDLRGVPEALTPRPKAIRHLRDLWDSKCSGTRLPAFGAFTFRLLQPWAADMAVLEPAPDGTDMFIRLAGRNINAIHSREVSGEWLGQLVPPGTRSAVLRPSRRALSLGVPQYERRSLNSDNGPVLHRQALPCASDGARPDIILVQVLYEQDSESPATAPSLVAAFGR